MEYETCHMVHIFVQAAEEGRTIESWNPIFLFPAYYSEIFVDVFRLD